MMKVCHLTSAHPQEDIRIFEKECVSLVNNGYETYQISCGVTYDRKGVHLIGVGTPYKGRFGRMTRAAKEVYKAALQLDADVYHFHDPELLPYGLKLKRKGKIVIFDSHEDIPAQIIDKPWIPRIIRKIVSELYKRYETHVVKELDAVVVATSFIAEKFKDRCNKIVIVNNYPKLDDIEYHDNPFESKENIICYAGGLSEVRGEDVMKQAMSKVNGRLLLAGDHNKETIDNAQYLGRLDREGINNLYQKSVAGLCLLKPIENYINSQPIKMYEYMAAGLPFICSDFPKWKKIVEETGAGFSVEFDDIDSIAELINLLLKNRTLAYEMGKRGHEYVINNCNWANEEKKLIELYLSL